MADVLAIDGREDPALRKLRVERATVDERIERLQEGAGSDSDSVDSKVADLTLPHLELRRAVLDIKINIKAAGEDKYISAEQFEQLRKELQLATTKLELFELQRRGNTSKDRGVHAPTAKELERKIKELELDLGTIEGY